MIEKLDAKKYVWNNTLNLAEKINEIIDVIDIMLSDVERKEIGRRTLAKEWEDRYR